MSRGATIITQKENKGEYGGSWTHNDADIYAHVFDQTNSSGTPYRYASATSFGSNVCSGSDIATTSGNTLYSGTRIISQKSCTVNTLNAGNWYSFPTATAGSNNASTSTETNMANSICPKGWQLPPNSGNKSYSNLISTIYKISSDSALLTNSAMSFVRLGKYYYKNGSLDDRGNVGNYWSSTAYSSTHSHHLYLVSGGLYPQYGDNRADSLSIRCMSR